MDNPFDQMVLNPRERPLSSDINLAQSQLYETMRELFMRQFQALGGSPGTLSAPPVSPGFIGDAFFCSPASPAAQNVFLRSGVGFIYNASDEPLSIGGIVGLDDVNPMKPLTLTQDLSIPLLTPFPAGQDRYDIIEVTYDRRLENPLTRDVLDPVAGVFNPTLVDKTLAWNQNNRFSSVVSPANSTAAIGYKAGVPATPGTAAIPANTPGYTTIAIIFIPSGTTTIGVNNIADNRKLLFPSNMGEAHFTMVFTVTSQVAPGLFNLIQPPGMRFIWAALPTFATAQHRLYLMGPHMNIVPLMAPDVSSAFIPTVLSGLSQGAINSSDQALISSFGVSPGFGSVPVPPIGAPYNKLDFQLTAISGSSIPSPNPAVYNRLLFNYF